MFIIKDKKVLINEIVLRIYNFGYYSLDVCEVF